MVEVLLLVPSRVRRPIHKHAFEEALETVSQDRADELDWPFAEDGEAPDDAGSASGPKGFVGDLLGAESYVGSGSLSAAYSAEVDPKAYADADDPMAAVGLVSRLIAGGLARKDLEQLRRKFAVRIHPDRVPRELRQSAVQAMAEINAKIDQALEATTE